MALFKCKNCKSSFPIYEMECAYCGYKNKRSQLGLVLTIGIMLVILVILYDKYLSTPTSLM